MSIANVYKSKNRIIKQQTKRCCTDRNEVRVRRTYVVNRATGNFRFDNAKCPPPKKNSRIFPFGKMLDFALSNTISTKLATFIWINYNDMVSLVKCTYATWSLKSWNLPKCQCHQQLITMASVPYVETDRQRSITVPLYQQSLVPSGQTSPGHCLPNIFFRTPSIPRRWMQKLGL